MKNRRTLEVPEPTNRTSTTANTAPLAGANSFTAAQARSHIDAVGHSDITDLKKNDHSILQGQ